MVMKAYMEPMATDSVCEDPFDSIDDLLVFPNDDLEGISMVDAWGNSAPIAHAPAPAVISVASGPAINAGGAADGVENSATVSGGGISSDEDALGLYDDIDIANLEWLSNFFEYSELNFDFCPASTPSTPNPKPSHKSSSLSRSLSPISVLLPASSSSSTTTSSSSSSNSITDTSPPPPPATVPAKARTKRPRLPSFTALTFIPPSPTIPNPFPTAIKKLKKDVESAAPSVRKCTHCDIQKTPQWRAGPTGPKTLCNACGVRYKSGRLFPEYRPAASPTFVPAVHSNSHKKVVEMRLSTVAPTNCDLVELIRRRE